MSPEGACAFDPDRTARQGLQRGIGRGVGGPGIVIVALGQVDVLSG